MNASRVQSLILSVFHDPSFLTRMQREPKSIEVDYGCTAQEIEHILSFDERLFMADPLRADRLLTGLLDLYSVSVWSVFEPTIFTTLRGFFSSRTFHRVIWERGFVHQSFARYLIKHYPSALPYVQLECAIEDARHAPRSYVHSKGDYVLHNRAHVLSMKTGYLDAFIAARSCVAQSASSGADFLLKVVSTLDEPKTDESTEFILVEGGVEPQVGGISASLARILMFVQEPRTHEALVTRLMDEGADKTECGELIADFLTNHWLQGASFFT